MQAYTPPLSLWHLVEQHVSPTEHDEIKNMLGASLVEQSLELHEEIDMLLDIWREMRSERKESFPLSASLPEPPDQRERLIQEICFYVDNVKAKAEEKGIDPQQILKKHNPDILDYAVGLSRPGSSMSRASHSSDGRETPMMSIAPQRINQDMEATDEVKAVNNQLNYLDFDTVCENLRSTLEKEVTQLMEDIQFLQGCLDSEADDRDCVTPRLTSREPTLTELREQRSSLEKELLATDNLKATPFVAKPSFNSTNKVLPRTPLGSPGSPSSPRHGQSGPGPGPGPLKANHNIVNPATAYSSTVSRKSQHTDETLPQQTASNILILSGKSSSNKDDGNTAASLASSSENTGLTNNRTKSSSVISNSRAAFTLPNPPSISHSGNESRQSRSYRRPPHAPDSPRLAEQTHVPSPPTKPSSEEIVLARGSGRRRTVSPGRVRVVDVSNFMENCQSKGDGAIPDFTSSPATSATASFIPSPPSSVSERDSTLRPGSAHADRFRKMVLGCRDGE